VGHPERICGISQLLHDRTSDACLEPKGTSGFVKPKAFPMKTKR
jgi:hypothetical protein